MNLLILINVSNHSISQILSDLLEVNESTSVVLTGLSDLGREGLHIIALLPHVLLYPLYQSLRARANGRFPVEDPRVLGIVHIMTQLINVEDALGHLLGLSEDHSVLLVVDVVSHDRSRFEQLAPFGVGRPLGGDHPGRGELRRLPDVYLSIFFNCMLSVQGLGVHSQPAGGATDDRHWKD